MKTITLASTLILGLATAGLSQTAQAGTLDLNELTVAEQTQATVTSNDLLVRVVDGDDHWPSAIGNGGSNNQAPVLNLNNVFSGAEKVQPDDWAQISRDYGTGDYRANNNGNLLDLFSKI